MSRWSRYGNYLPGLYGLPHMGTIIADYRKRYGCETQQDLAIVAGVDKQTVNYWETSMYLADMERRIFLAKLLKIPPALLGLTLYSMVDDEKVEEYIKAQEQMVGLIEEDAYYIYEDVLTIGSEYLFKGGEPYIAYRFYRRLEKLKNLVQHAPSSEREAWETLLCRYYQLATRFAKRENDQQKVLYNATQAIQIAIDLGDDKTLLASSYFRRVHVYMGQNKLNLARDDMQAAMQLVEHVRNPLQGNIYLHAAELETMWAKDDQGLQKQIREWQHKVTNALYKKSSIDDDGTFLKLNLAGVHHERAKTLLQFYLFTQEDKKSATFKAKKSSLLDDARHEMEIAWKLVEPDLLSWHVNFALTDAKLYRAENDMEGSVKAGKRALKIAQLMHSQNKVGQVKQLHASLCQVDAKNPYVRNLGVALGVF